MELGMVGLGKMGANMTRRLRRDGHRVVVFDRDSKTVEDLVKEGAEGSDSLADLASRLAPPRAVWIMVPAGDPTESTVESLAGILEDGDLVVDGGNSWFKDSVRRGKMLAAKGVAFVDVGVSGGVWGLEEGYSMMAGGAEADVERIRPALETLAPGPRKGWGRVGESGAGHYVKMVHNGIEYGVMQAYAEGFEIFHRSAYDLDLEQICGVWGDGSVVRSWLLELAGRAFAEDADLSRIEDYVPDSGEGRWTLQESVDLEMPAPVLYAALMTRFRSRQDSAFQAKVLAALRHQFGGHAVRKASS